MERDNSISAQQEVKDLLENDPDWILSRRHGFSLAKIAEKYPDGVPDSVICDVLALTQEELEEHYQEIISELRKTLKVNP